MQYRLFCFVKKVRVFLASRGCNLNKILLSFFVCKSSKAATLVVVKTPTYTKQFCALLWDWYSRHKRTLPWRDLQLADLDQKAYMILVSEVMLQQTQVSRVLIKWKEWLEVFPTLQHLASANNKQVIMAWEGMGYNSRALRLRDMAIAIVSNNNGQFPREYTELLALKGIGPYTAAAVRNFAFGLPTPCIDTNIRRILHRTFIGPENQFGEYSASDKEVIAIAEQVLQVALNTSVLDDVEMKFQSPPTAEWHAALMDFGSLVCTKISPKWDVCPITAAGINKSAYKVPKLQRKPKNEPGRLVGNTFVPNRIFRGRIVQVLREHSQQSLEQIGLQISVDWQSDTHSDWLTSLLLALQKDALIIKRSNTYSLVE